MITHWTARRKAQVVHDVLNNGVSAEQVMREYSISVDELHSWIALLQSYGIRGLMVTRRVA